MAATVTETAPSFYRCLCLIFLYSLMVFSCQADIYSSIPGLQSVQLTTVASVDKNSGPLLSEELEDDGYMLIGSTANNKGAHLATAVATLQSSHDSKSQVLLANTETPAFASGQSLAQQTKTGTNIWTESLYPYLVYYGGAVMSQLSAKKPFNVALIFYGKKWTTYQKYVVRNFIKSITPSVKSKSAKSRTVENWWRITTRYYYDSQGRNITKQVRIAGQYNDSGSAYPRGTTALPLRNKDIKAIVVNALKKKFGLPNSRTVYLVLTDSATVVQDFCTTMCSYHSNFRYKKRPAIYLFAGNAATQCPYRCTFKYFTARYKPSNSLGVDGMINWIAHGLTAVATNPLSGKNVKPGWVVPNTTLENSDFCQLDFGYIGYTSTYAIYNVRGNSDMRFLIQRNWNRALQACTITGSGFFDTPLPTTPS